MDYAARANEVLVLTDPLERPMQFCGLFREWLNTDMESALAYLRQMPRGNEYVEGVGMVLDRLQLSQPERAVAVAGELVTRHEEMHLYNRLFSALASSNPSMGVRLLDQVPEGTPRANTIRALASTWSQTDPESAWNWAVNLPQATEAQLAGQSALSILAAQNPAEAIERAKLYLTGEALKTVIEQARLVSSSPLRPLNGE
jgi:hypothetical protein